MTANNRNGERGSVPYRNGRLHCINEQWFYAVRGPSLRGPYDNPDDAEKALARDLRKHCR